VALGAERWLGFRRAPRRGRLALAGALVLISIAVQAWGIAWARTLGW